MKSNRSLGEFEVSVLFALLDPESDTHGAGVARVIEQRTGSRPSSGAVSTTLLRLERRAMVTSRLGHATPERGGRRKKHYELTRLGAQALADAHDRLRRMSAGTMPRLNALLSEGKGTKG
jgi:PadR family transcriptional regulator PadR